MAASPACLGIHRQVAATSVHPASIHGSSKCQLALLNLGCDTAITFVTLLQTVTHTPLLPDDTGEAAGPLVPRVFVFAEFS